MNGWFKSDAHTAGVGRQPELVGRQAEREILMQLVTSARSGQSRVLVVCGEAGVGKTALLDDLVTQASPWRIARAAGIEAEAECTFAALHRLCAVLQDRMERLPCPQRSALAAAFGQRNPDGPDHFMVGMATLSLLSHAPGEQPLICVIDDAQWLDRASAQALGFAARRLATGPVALILALRQPFADQYCAEQPQLTLPPLADEDAKALLDARLTGPVDSGVRDRMLAEARGIPLRLLEAASAQSPEELAGGFGLPVAVAASDPEGTALLRDLDTLPRAARLLLLIAAAEPTGSPVLVWRAADLLGVKAAPEISAVTSAIMEFGAPLRFRHPLARSVVYWAASRAERQDAHLALAAGIDPDDDPHRQAWHLAHASPGLDEDVAATMAALADSVVTRGGQAASAMFYETAAIRTAEATHGARRALDAARAKHLLGADGSALRLLAIAQAGPLDHYGRARASLLHAQLMAGRNLADGACGLLLRAAQQLEAPDPVLAREGYCDALRAALARGRLAGRGDLLEVAAAVRTAWAGAGRRSSADLTEGLAVLVTEGAAVGAPAVRRALSDIGGDPDSSAALLPAELRLACGAAQALWDHEAWSRLSGLLVQEAERTGSLGVLLAALHHTAMARVVAGDFTSAAASAGRAEAIARAVDQPADPYGSLALAAWSGDRAEIARLAGAVTPGMLARGEGRWLTAVGWATAVASNSLGQYDQALAAAEEAAADADELGLAAWSLAELAEAAARLGFPERAHDALDRLGELAKASTTDWASGLLARSQALVSEDPTAEESYREAINLLDRAGVQAEAARARLLYGEWLRRRRQRVDAREQLRAAHQALATMGATGFASRARRELMATGEVVRRHVSETSLALTGQEAQIARLASDGLTNAEIGVRLFLSKRTVEWHLAKVYTKLAVRSRRELRGALVGAGLQRPGSLATPRHFSPARK